MSDAIDALYNRVMDVINQSYKLIEMPQVPDMEHIKSEVQHLCEEINALPIQHRVGYAEKFKHLFEALTDLEVALKAKRDEVEKMLSGTNTHHKATTAYTKTFHSDKPTGN